MFLGSEFKEFSDALRDLIPFVQSKNVKNTHGGVILLIKLQASAYNFTKSNTPPWVFFTFFKLYKWYQIAQSVAIILKKVGHWIKVKYENETKTET